MLHKTENWENEALITQWSNLPLKAVLKSDLKHLIPNEWKKSNLGESGRMRERQLYFTGVAQSAARLVSLGALGSIKITYKHLQ